MSDRTCSVEDCEYLARSRGWCNSHYARWQKHGNPLGGKHYRGSRRSAVDPFCSVDGCGHIVECRGWCRMHYARWQRTGDPQVDVPRRERRETCSVEGCDQRHFGHGYCTKHHARWRRHGDPHVRLKGDGGTGHIDKYGYRQVFIAGRQVLEHRHVMEQHLGRPLAPYENVHHRNGRRADNDIANLELWVKPQPAGQRPDDLAAWVVEHYPELVEAALADRRQLRLAI